MDETETWKDIPGHSNYQASDLGRIRRGEAVLDTHPRGEYGHLAVTADWRSLPVHRAVALAFHGHPPEGKELVRHLDGDPTNNRPENLKWGDPFENAQDMVAHGTQRKRTLCKKAHSLTAENTFVPRDGRPRCKKCIDMAVDATMRDDLPARKGWRRVPPSEQIDFTEWQSLLTEQQRKA